MKKTAFLISILTFLVLAGLPARAEEGQGPIEKFTQTQANKIVAGCQDELNTYCANVTPGGGRQAACIFAYSDKLSPKCESALYEANEEFVNAAENLGAFAKACKVDVARFCSGTEIGKGRIIACLHQNKGKVSAPCTAMLQKSTDNLGQPGAM